MKNLVGIKTFLFYTHFYSVYFFLDPLLIEKYLQNIRVVFNQSFVTTVFHALHLGLNVPYIDIQRAIDHCQYRLVTFEITNYIKVNIHF